ncbi:hypothetical protein FB451DRAFT_1524211 [Mycena latifolia]|nr:hypothetical protein FB451DRAFT_1524211 [Mycena latifolia]
MDLLKRKPHSDPALFLPVYYANLGPVGIPTAAGLDSWTMHVSSINRALLSLQGTTQLWMAGFRWPDGLLSELWPRIWSWVRFLDVYNETIQAFIPLSQVDAYSLYMRSSIEVLTNSTVVPLASIPSHMRVLAGRAWRITLPPVPGRNTMAHSDVVRFLGNDTESGRPSNFREYLEGVGTVNDFAKLIIRHIARAMPVKPLFIFFQLSGMLRMLVERNDHSGPLHKALLDHGIVKALMNVACHYATSDAEDTVAVVAMCFTLLQRAFSTHSQVTLQCVQRPGTHWNHCLRPLLERVLPRSMVSYHVVRALSRYRTDEQRLLPVLDFQDGALSALWESFNTLATGTVSTLQAYDSGAYQSIRACDNMECGRLCRRNEIKRCSSCHQTNYCSVRCQSIDWHVDGHRAICPRLRPLRPAEHPLLSARDGSFLRALIHHLHETRIVAWCMQKVHFMYVHPGVPFYVLCDYTHGGAIVAAHACAEVPRDAARSSAARWEDQVARMGRSGGRMDIAVVLVASGTRKLRHVAALRTKSSALNDALARTATSLSPSLDRTTVESMPGGWAATQRRRVLCVDPSSPRAPPARMRSPSERASAVAAAIRSMIPLPAPLSSRVSAPPAPAPAPLPLAGSCAPRAATSAPTRAGSSVYSRMIALRAVSVEAGAGAEGAEATAARRACSSARRTCGSARRTRSAAIAARDVAGCGGDAGNGRGAHQGGEASGGGGGAGGAMSVGIGSPCAVREARGADNSDSAAQRHSASASSSTESSGGELVPIVLMRGGASSTRAGAAARGAEDLARRDSICARTSAAASENASRV